jgi:rhamnosyltransferase
VVAVIPTFAPTSDLLGLLASLIPQVDSIVVSDDASLCTSDAVLREAQMLPTVTVLRHRRNEGIARGLNDGLDFAILRHSSWLLTVDQDSEVGEDYVATLLDHAQSRLARGERLAAVGALTVLNTSGPMRYPHAGPSDFPQTEEIIQTGSLWAVRNLQEIGGFRLDFGIDAVDAAACLALRERGYTIGLDPSLTIRHAIGNGRAMRMGGRNVMITGHSPARRTSMLRNRLQLFPAEFKRSPRHAIRTIRRVVVNQSLGLLVEDGRSAKARGTLAAFTRKKSR